MPQLWHIGDQYTKYCTEPKGERNLLRFWVGERVSIADIFDSNGEIPDWIKLKPKHSISVLGKCHLCNLIRRLSLSNFLKFDKLTLDNRL